MKWKLNYNFSFVLYVCTCRICFKYFITSPVHYIGMVWPFPDLIRKCTEALSRKLRRESQDKKTHFSGCTKEPSLCISWTSKSCSAYPVLSVMWCQKQSTKTVPRNLACKIVLMYHSTDMIAFYLLRLNWSVLNWQNFAVNDTASLLTRVQKMFFDYHFKVEQEAGSATFSFFSFNGTHLYNLRILSHKIK